MRRVLLSNSYATGSVDGSSSVGGLVGSSHSDISNSYATGSVDGSSSVGGLVGSSNGVNISNSCGSGGAGSLLSSMESATGAGTTTPTYINTWECYGALGPNNQISDGGTAPSLFNGWSSDNWDYSGTSFLPTLKLDIATAQLQYVHQHVGQWQLLDATVPVLSNYDETVASTFTLPNAEGSVPVGGSYTVTVNWDTITGDYGDSGTYNLSSPADDTLGSLQYNPVSGGTILNISQPDSGTQNVYLRGVVTVMDGSTTVQVYNQDFPFSVTKP